MRIKSATSPPITKARRPVVKYMIPINLWSVVVSHMVIGRKKPSSYVFVRGGATVVNVACSLDRASSQEGGRECCEPGVDPVQCRAGFLARNERGEANRTSMSPDGRMGARIPH